MRLPSATCDNVDGRHQWSRGPERGQPAVGPVEIVLLQQVAHHEPVERQPAGDQLAYGRIPALQPQVAGIQTGRLDGDVSS